MATSTTSRVATSDSGNAGKSGKGGDGDADGGGKDAGKKSKKKLIMIVVALLVVGLGAKMTVLKPKPTAAALAEAKKTAPAEFGPIVALDEQTLNLADGHYLKLKVVIQMKLKSKAPAVGEAGTTTPELTAAAQAVLDTYSALTQAQLTGVAGQTKAKAALVKKLAPVYPGIVEGIMTPEFLMSS